MVSNTGVVAADVTVSGAGANQLAAASYGGDKALFGYGYNGAGSGGVVSTTILVSNVGVVAATNTSGVGTARYRLAAAGYSFSA